MSFLSRLFGSRGGGHAPRDVDIDLELLENEAAQSRPGYVGTAFNKAGDLALKTDQPDRAVGNYGRAIDAFLEDGQRELARGVAIKIIRVRPTAVRTLSTLTWLDLAARHQATALLHLRDYVDAAGEAGQNARAATQIHSMARLTTDAQFVDAVADSLDSLDFPLRATEVRGWASTGSPGAILEAHALADACLVAALRSNDRDAVLLVDDPEAEAHEAAADGTDEADESTEEVNAPIEETRGSTGDTDNSPDEADGTSEDEARDAAAPEPPDSVTNEDAEPTPAVDSKSKGGQSKKGSQSKKGGRSKTNRKKSKKKH